MQSQVLQSRLLHKAHRDGDGNVILEFVDGAIIGYKQVPATVFDTLLQASSPGSYYHSKWLLPVQEVLLNRRELLPYTNELPYLK